MSSGGYTAEVASPGGPSVDALFRPSSVVVVGASTDLSKPGGRCFQFLRQFGFPGDLYAVNPKYDQINGVRCYPDIESLPDSVDLAVLLMPADDVPAAIRSAARRGARAAIVCSSGFGEIGVTGMARDRALARVAAETGLAVLGPNSLGVLDMNANLAATFSTSLQFDVPLQPGPIALVSQSGAMGAAIYGLAQLEGVGVGTFVSTGNETALGFGECVRYLADLEETTVILGYLEGIRDGAGLVAAAQYARQRGKVIAVMKSGRTEAGARAARSHTGALAGSAEVWDAAFRRAGILAARSPRELLDIGVACAPGRFPASNRVGVISMSGGAGAVMSDRLAELGLQVAELSEATKASLRALLPVYTQVGNPVDYGGIYTDADKIEQLARAIVADSNVDTLLCFIGLSPLLLGDLDVRLGQVRVETDKLVAAAWLGGPPEGVSSLRRLGIPAYEDPVRAVDAVAALWAASRPLLAEPPVPPSGTFRSVVPDRAGTLGERDTKRLLAAYGIPVVEEALAETGARAEELAVRFGGLVALKVEADELLHKSDIGAVRLGVPAARVAAAFEEVISAARAAGVEGIRGTVVQPMAAPGLELLAGVKQDRQFGPVVAIGLGGVASEALGDVVVELAPLSLEHARAMFDRLRGRALLGSFRGSAPRDVDALGDLLVALGWLAVDAGPRLIELDCNPVIVYAQGAGCLVVDAAAVLSPDVGSEGVAAARPELGPRNGGSQADVAPP